MRSVNDSYSDYRLREAMCIGCAGSFGPSHSSAPDVPLAGAPPASRSRVGSAGSHGSGGMGVMRPAGSHDSISDLRNATFDLSVGNMSGVGASRSAADTPGMPRPVPRPATEAGAGASIGTACPWRLSSVGYAPETMPKQTLEEEMKRLKILQSYQILDTRPQKEFERVTAMASRVLHVPIALVSLVDLARQWFLSNHGLGVVRETPRDVAFCSHTIAQTQDLMIVKDTLLDERFRHNSLVQGDPKIRFYAGAPLVCPEGAKLGTLCIIDTKPRTQDLTLAEKQNLREFAGMAVDLMVAQRREKMKDKKRNQARTIACTAHDMLTPLSGIQMSLQLINADSRLMQQVDEQQKELLDIACTSSQLLTRICNKAIEDFRQETPYAKSITSDPDDMDGILNIKKLVQNLHKVIEPLPKKVPLTLSVDEMVPPIVLAQDLEVFRCALNYLTEACTHTQTGFVHMRIFVKEEEDLKHLVFECEDTGQSIEVENYPNLFEAVMTDARGNRMNSTRNLGLYSVSNIVKELGGECGFRTREQSMSRHSNHDSNDSLTVTSSPLQMGMETDSAPKGSSGSIHKPTGPVGSIFWFSIPLIIPSSDLKGPSEVIGKNEERNTIYKSGSGNAFDESATSREKRIKLGGSTEQLKAMGIGNDTISEQRRKYSYSYWVRSQQGTNNSSAPQQLQRPSPCEKAVPQPNGMKPSKEGHPAVEEKRVRKAVIIDDSLTIRKSLGRALSKIGFDVTFACNGLEGLDAMKETIFDITLCDFLMPIMDGLDCVQQFRAWEMVNRSWFRQYITGISAHATNSDSERGLKVGMDSFFSKPVSLKSLQELSKCPEVMEKSKQLDDMHAESKKIEVADKETTRPLVSPEKSHGLVCLIAEDSKVEGMALARVIEKSGFRVSVVENGEDALRLLKMRQWNVVFLDDCMPLLTGSRCVLKFREWEATNRVSRANNIYLMSGNYAVKKDTTGVTMFPRGFNGAIGKPLQLKHLGSILEKAAAEQDQFVLNRVESSHKFLGMI